VAPSGGGKSTFAAQFPFPDLLADERVLLTPRDGGWVATPPPPGFRGSRIGRGWDPVPLRAILLPGRGPGVCVRDAPPAVALARLVSQTFTLAQEEGGYGPHIARCRDVVARIPAARLTFTPPAPLAPAIGAWLAARS
jgi:hypothetical protein